MKAADIVTAYRAAAKATGLEPKSWIKLLLVASHGEDGCRAASLHTHGAAPVYHLIRAWEKKGLVTRFKVQLTTQPQAWLKITPHGLASLQLTP